jgi:DNA-nicking Smr family endonuclease
MLSKNGVLKKIKNPPILIGSFFLLNLSHKIKFNLNKQQNKKPLEEQPNEKISISINSSRETKKKIENIDNKNIKAKKILVKPVLLDANLHKQFKNHHFSKIDLHGLTVDQAHQKLIEYFSINYKKKNLFHIVVTGLGNKTNGEEFFTGKIRRQFPFWLDTEKFQFMIKSYSPCKIQHGGLGAFYIKLKSKE